MSYAARNLVDWEGVKPSREVCRTSMLSVTSPARNFLEARGGVEPRAFPPSSSEVRFRRPMPGTRAAVWCPRKDLNLQPLVCRTSAPSIELLGLVWWSELDSNQPLGFFKPRANPPQLSDQSALSAAKWNSWQDLNPQLRRSKRRALPVELQEHEIWQARSSKTLNSGSRQV